MLEGLEPVRRHPGMYVGGTDARALHHLAAEVLDNAMDEAVAGHATRIEITLEVGNWLTVADNGRGMPVDPHPRFPDRSALEVIMTTLHAGAKFSGKAYETSGGLHGVGVSAVNALSDALTVEVARDRTLYRQSFARGIALGPLEALGTTSNRRGTSVRFHPDPEIFGDDAQFSTARLLRLARSKAYLFGGVEIRWRCDPELAGGPDDVPERAVFQFPGGLSEHLSEQLDTRETATAEPFAGKVTFIGAPGSLEWAVAWPLDADGAGKLLRQHDSDARRRHARGRRARGAAEGAARVRHADRAEARGRTAGEDASGGAAMLFSLFLPNPTFQSQTKDRLTSPEAARLVENALRDHFDHWLAADGARARALLAHALERMDERLRRRAEKEIARKTPTSARRLRLPGKLTDCARDGADGTEIFIVEGDSAGVRPRQARDRVTQAILPIRGKILNVASATSTKVGANQEIASLELALGCGCATGFGLDALRYQRVVIMTDADVDGAHIATLPDDVLLPRDGGAGARRATVPGAATSLPARGGRRGRVCA